jgi:hypothetical protein
MVPPATELAVAGRDLPRLTCGGRADDARREWGWNVDFGKLTMKLFGRFRSVALAVTTGVRLNH